MNVLHLKLLSGHCSQSSDRETLNSSSTTAGSQQNNICELTLTNWCSSKCELPTPSHQILTDVSVCWYYRLIIGISIMVTNVQLNENIFSLRDYDIEQDSCFNALISFWTNSEISCLHYISLSQHFRDQCKYHSFTVSASEIEYESGFKSQSNLIMC